MVSISGFQLVTQVVDIADAMVLGPLDSDQIAKVKSIVAEYTSD